MQMRGHFDSGGILYYPRATLLPNCIHNEKDTYELGDIYCYDQFFFLHLGGRSPLFLMPTQEIYFNQNRLGKNQFKYLPFLPMIYWVMARIGGDRFHLIFQPRLVVVIYECFQQNLGKDFKSGFGRKLLPPKV